MSLGDVFAYVCPQHFIVHVRRGRRLLLYLFLYICLC
jgi:hypothetical protein